MNLEKRRVDDTTDRAWWQLHVRAARGEHLAPEEQTSYEEGLRHLEAAETLDGGIDELRRVRAAVLAAEADRDRLQQRRTQLEREIALLESALSERTRHLLEAGD